MNTGQVTPGQGRPRAAETRTSEAALRIEHLAKTFAAKDGKVAALAGVSLEVREGELFTLLGPSGCGKTTTLRCVAGFEAPTSGSISFRGDDFTSVPPFRRNIGMVFQSYALFPHLSIHENVAYGLRVRRVPRGVIQDKVRAILQLVGLEAAGNRKPGELSGGQQQRVALARALVYDPRLLLLDEPFIGVAPLLVEEILAALRRIAEQGVTMLLVEQNTHRALDFVDRAYVLENGRTVLEGSREDLLGDPAFAAKFLGLE